MNTFVASPDLALTVAHQTVADRVADAEHRALARAARAERRAARRETDAAERSTDPAVPAALVGLPVHPPCPLRPTEDRLGPRGPRRARHG